MAKFGLLINYDYCTGCHTCEVACQQEHDYPVGKCGIVVTEYVMQANRKPVAIDYLPFPTDLCDLCGQRTSEKQLPACVKHCQADCMRYGPITKLVKEMEGKPKMVLFKPL